MTLYQPKAIMKLYISWATKTLSPIILAVLFISCDKQSVTVTGGLAAYYPFNGNANDESENDYHGIVNGAILTEDRFGDPNKAYQFDGSSNYIRLGSDFDYPSRTINLWFYANIIDEIERHIYISDNPQLLNGFTQIKIKEYFGKKLIRSSAGIPGGVAEGNSEVSEKEWYMITLVVDESSTRHYLNGILIGEFGRSNSSSYNGVTSALLGTSRVFDRYFDGKIDDVRIYARALSESEIKQLYRNNTL
jgi:hypothetical protein